MALRRPHPDSDLGGAVVLLGVVQTVQLAPTAGRAYRQNLNSNGTNLKTGGEKRDKPLPRGLCSLPLFTLQRLGQLLQQQLKIDPVGQTTGLTSSLSR